jgi:hypothetical protein
MQTQSSGGIAPPFLNSALHEGVWSASRPGCFIPGEKALGTHFIGGWVGSRTRLDHMEKEKSLAPAGIEARILVPIPTELFGSQY